MHRSMYLASNMLLPTVSVGGGALARVVGRSLFFPFLKIKSPTLLRRPGFDSSPLYYLRVFTQRLGIEQEVGLDSCTRDTSDFNDRITSIHSASGSLVHEDVVFATVGEEEHIIRCVSSTKLGNRTGHR